MLLTQEQILAKIQADLNALVIELGFIDDNGNPLYYFHGELSTYDDYSWIKSIELLDANEAIKYLNVIPFVVIRENSTTSAGETISERFDEYSFYAYIKTDQIEAIRELIEIYMAQENLEENLVAVEHSTVLKNFSNFIIGDEQLDGAPDAISRHQVSLLFTYDIFDENLNSSKDYTFLIDGVKVKYLSWRFEKANMIIANSENTPIGFHINNVNKLHEISFTTELYIDKTNAAAMKVFEDLFTLTKTNTSYQIQLQKDGVDIFNMPMIFNGGKATDTPPQINAIEATFTLSYERAKVSIGLEGVVDENGEVVLEDIPVLGYTFGHAAALFTAAYFSDNASKSKVIGLAKGFALTIPVLTSGSDIMTALITEVLGKVYTNKYILRFIYLGVTRLYTVVLTESGITSDDAAYDILKLAFLEAK